MKTLNVKATNQLAAKDMVDQKSVKWEIEFKLDVPEATIDELLAKQVAIMFNRFVGLDAKEDPFAAREHCKVTTMSLQGLIDDLAALNQGRKKLSPEEKATLQLQRKVKSGELSRDEALAEFSKLLG